MRVFVVQKHSGCGVLLVPRTTFETLRDDGYRAATAAEVASWYRVRGLTPPVCVVEQARTGVLRAPVVFGVAEGDSELSAA
jgi:hypothetical protein